MTSLPPDAALPASKFAAAVSPASKEATVALLNSSITPVQFFFPTPRGQNKSLRDESDRDIQVIRWVMDWCPFFLPQVTNPVVGVKHDC